MVSSTDGKIVIAGAGLTGMMAALLLRKHYPEQPIQIIESASVPGGNYRCIDYGPNGQFDQGMRILYESGIPEFDALIRSILPESEWHILSGNAKDIAGIFWNGTLQTYSQYIDLRRLPDDKFALCKTELLHAINASVPLDTTNAETYLHSRFGKKTGNYLCAALNKLHGLPANQLDVMATKQPAMDRVILFDCDIMKDLLNQETLRSRIAWPDQLTLPILRHFNQSALYPKKYGMNHVIDALRLLLEEKAVEFTFSDTIQSITANEKHITQLTTHSSRRIDNIRHLFWTGGLPALSALLNSTPKNLSLPAPPKAILIHICLPHPPEIMKNLYHFYCFDSGFHTFRITHYANYCPEAKQTDGYPICMELWNLQADDANVIKTALSELRMLGISEGTDNVVIKGISRIPNLHAYCSIEAVAAMRYLRESIAKHELANMTTLGVFSEENQMLLYEVWRDMCKKIEYYAK